MSDRDEMIRKHINNALTEAELIDLLESEREKSERYKQALMTIAVGDNHFAEFEDIAKWALEGYNS